MIKVYKVQEVQSVWVLPANGQPYWACEKTGKHIGPSRLEYTEVVAVSDEIFPPWSGYAALRVEEGL